MIENGFAQKVRNVLIFRSESAPEEHDVYSLVFFTFCAPAERNVL